MRPRSVVLAVSVGLLLASLPFVRYLNLGGGGEAHSNHEPRHGGQLGMVGDHHVELRRHSGMVEAFVSDAWRRPVRPRQGWVVFDRGERTPLRWEGHRLIGPDTVPAREVEAIVLLDDGRRLAISFDLSTPP